MSKESPTTSPIRSENFHEFTPLHRPEAEQSVDTYMLLSLLSGVLAVATHLRFYAWLTLLFFLASLVNIRYSEVDLKQVFASFMLVVLTFVSCYINPTGRPMFLPTMFGQG